MKLLRSLIAATPAAASLTAQAADTNTAVTDTGWYAFFHGDVGSAWLNDYAFNDPGMQSFSFSLSGPATLRVAEGGLAGDAFKVFDNGVLLGSTSSPTGGATDDAGVNFDAAMSGSKWSHGEWLLGAGQHVITGLASASPYAAGTGALQVVAVPEPVNYALFLAGLGLIGFVANRRSGR